MKKFFALTSVTLLTVGAVIGANAPASPPPTSESPAPATATSSPAPAKIELKNKSSFTMDVGSRNPFWPIGWKPTGKLTGAGSTDAAGDIPVSAFLISTITVDQGGRFAIINGKTMQEGQQFGLLLGTQTYRIVVKKIEDGRVILGRQDQEIIVPLHRK